MKEKPNKQDPTLSEALTTLGVALLAIGLVISVVHELYDNMVPTSITREILPRWKSWKFTSLSNCHRMEIESKKIMDAFRVIIAPQTGSNRSLIKYKGKLRESIRRVRNICKAHGYESPIKVVYGRDGAGGTYCLCVDNSKPYHLGFVMREWVRSTSVTSNLVK